MSNQLTPIIYMFDLLGNLLLKEPSFGLLSSIEFENIDNEYIKNLNQKIQYSIQDEYNFQQINEVYSHLFTKPSKCMLTTHESIIYFSRIKPDFLNNVLSKLNIQMKPNGRNYPDHIGNQTLLIAYIYKILQEETEKDFQRSIVVILKDFLKSHYIKFLKELIIEINVCHCYNDFNIYKDIIMFLFTSITDLPYFS